MQKKFKAVKLTLQRQSAQFIDCWFWHFKSSRDDVLLQLQEELIARQFLAQSVRLRRVKLNFQVKRVGRADLDLFLDSLGRIQPVFNIVGIGELQAKVILFDEVERVEDLLVQIISERLLLQTLKAETASENVNVLKAIKSKSVSLHEAKRQQT